MGRRADKLTGRVFGELTVLQRIGSRNGSPLWECRCSCGNMAEVMSSCLRYGKTQSCGHLIGDAKRIHGLSKTPEFHAWNSARERCTNPSNPRYVNYGGRGIKMCDEWLDSFPTFLAHVGERPYPWLSLDRIDNDGNYEPGNVRWATRIQQKISKRKHGRYTQYTLTEKEAGDGKTA